MTNTIVLLRYPPGLSVPDAIVNAVGLLVVGAIIVVFLAKR